ncbi:MAG TPA: hypothetical protein VF692_13690 [Pyrinomonadaceae bacterium]|jgi:site-specific DNA-adenine methylase
MATYTGGKGGSGVYQKIISMMPPHKVYIEPFLGNGFVLRNKKPAELNIGIEIDEKVIADYWKGDEISNLYLVNENCLPRLENGDWITSNPKETLIYCDPPYLLETRRSQRQLYRYDMMTEEQHYELLRILIDLPCLVMISGYASEFYDSILHGWRYDYFHTTNRAGERTTEYVYMNFPEPMELHDYTHLGEDYRERQDIKRQRQRWINNLEKMPMQKRFALMSAIEEFKASRTGESADDRATA